MLKVDMPTGKKISLWVIFALTMLPCIVIGVYFRPYGQAHIGLLLGGIISWGFMWWTFMNLYSGVYKSKQGVYQRSKAPVRY